MLLEHLCYNIVTASGKSDSAVVRALVFHRCGPGFDSLNWRNMMVGFCCWFSSLPWRLMFGSFRFSSSQKPTFLIPIRPGDSGRVELPQGKSTAKFPLLFSHYYYCYYYYYDYYYYYYLLLLVITKENDVRCRWWELKSKIKLFMKARENARDTVAHCLSLRRIHSQDRTSFLHRSLRKAKNQCNSRILFETCMEILSFWFEKLQWTVLTNCI